jgi:uncharacterized protein (TIGR00251 family)
MRIKVKVKPNSSKEEVKKLGKGSYVVYVKKPAVDNKANMALVKLLKKHFNSGVEIKSGFTGRNKIVEVGG